jgi:predicted transcriptional regulator
VPPAAVLQKSVTMALQSGSILMSSSSNDEVSRDDVLRMAVDVVAAYLSNNAVATSQISEIIHNVFNSLTTLDGQPVEAPAEALKPATTIRKSVTPDYIVCLEDGKKLKMLKRHLRTTYNMTPEEYRAKWNLPPDYPMVAPNYAQQRSDFAKRIGLGRKAQQSETFTKVRA